MAEPGPHQDQNRQCQLFGCESPATELVEAAGQTFAMCERHGRRLAAAVRERERPSHYQLAVRYERDLDGSETADVLWFGGSTDQLDA